MTISKSKRQLAQLLIEAGVTQFPKGASWAAQDKVNEGGYDRFVGFYEGDDAPKCITMSTRMWRCYSRKCKYMVGRSVQLPTLIPNWYQTVLSRDEFDQIVAETVVQGEPQYCESVMRSIPEPVATPTLDRLLQDWRNAGDYAQRKQTEADEAAAMRDERWQAVQARAGEMGVTVGRCESVVESEPEREWEIHDRCVVVDAPDDRSWEGLECTLVDIDSDGKTLTYCVRDDSDRNWWVRGIRRP